jgi:hypothetical protein
MLTLAPGPSAANNYCAAALEVLRVIIVADVRPASINHLTSDI